MSVTVSRIRHQDFLEPGVLDNPYPLLARLRESERELASRRLGSVWLLRYDSVSAALRDPTLSVAAVGQSLNRLAGAMVTSEERAAFEHSFACRTDLLFYVDPPRHGRLRGLLQGWFTPESVAKRRPRIEELAGEVLDRVPREETFDVVQAVAEQLPAMVIAEMIGLELHECHHLRTLSERLVATATRTRLNPNATLAARDEIEAFQAFLVPRFSDRLLDPRDDVVTMLACAVRDGACSEREAVSLCMTLAVGGYETTRDSIANVVLTLLRHPDAIAAIRVDGSMLPPAIEEVFRIESPVQITARIAQEEREVAEVRVRPGMLVECWIGAANRDPERFPDPDRFDISRSPNRHLGFSIGHHHCLGFALARLETEAVVARLLERWPRLRLAETSVEWRRNGMFRSPARVVVAG